jgi:hypothetical protein
MQPISEIGFGSWVLFLCLAPLSVKLFLPDPAELAGSGRHREPIGTLLQESHWRFFLATEAG